MIIKNGYSRSSWPYFLTRKADSDQAFDRFLAGVRADGFTSVVQIGRSDNGRDFFGEKFRTVCDKLLIKQELTPANSPHFDGAAERALGITEATTMAARISGEYIVRSCSATEDRKVVG